MAMLVDAPHQIVRHPDVERSVALTRHDVDVVGHGAIVARAAARLIPIVQGERRSGRPGFRIALACARLSGMTGRSEEHTSELQSLMRISYAVFCLKKKR